MFLIGNIGTRATTGYQGSWGEGERERERERSGPMSDPDSSQHQARSGGSKSKMRSGSVVLSGRDGPYKCTWFRVCLRSVAWAPRYSRYSVRSSLQIMMPSPNGDSLRMGNLLRCPRLSLLRTAQLEFQKPPLPSEVSRLGQPCPVELT